MSLSAPFLARRHMDGVPRPPSNADVRAGGSVQKRVLIVGSGPAVGWGVLTHDVALAGHLARLLAKTLHGGVEVSVRADPAMTAKSLATALDAAKGLGDYDALILTVGVNDAIAGTNPNAWSRRLDAAASVAESRGVKRSAIVLVQIQPIAPIPAYGRRFGIRVDLHRRALNAASARLFHAPGLGRTEHLSPPNPIPERFRGSTVYARWAHDLLPTLVDLLRSPVVE